MGQSTWDKLFIGTQHNLLPPTPYPPLLGGGGGGVVKFCWVDRYIYPTSTGNQINPPPPRPYLIPNRRYVVSVGVKPDNSLFFFFFPFSIKYGRGIVRLNIHRDTYGGSKKNNTKMRNQSDLTAARELVPSGNSGGQMSGYDKRLELDM